MQTRPPRSTAPALSTSGAWKREKPGVPNMRSLPLRQQASPIECWIEGRPRGNAHRQCDAEGLAEAGGRGRLVPIRPRWEYSGPRPLHGAHAAIFSGLWITAGDAQAQLRPVVVIVRGRRQLMYLSTRRRLIARYPDAWVLVPVQGMHRSGRPGARARPSPKHRPRESEGVQARILGDHLIRCARRWPHPQDVAPAFCHGVSRKSCRSALRTEQ
jgi:hypothetical protein